MPRLWYSVGCGRMRDAVFERLLGFAVPRQAAVQVAELVVGHRLPCGIRRRRQRALQLVIGLTESIALEQRGGQLPVRQGVVRYLRGHVAPEGKIVRPHPGVVQRLRAEKQAQDRERRCRPARRKPQASGDVHNRPPEQEARCDRGDVEVPIRHRRRSAAAHDHGQRRGQRDEKPGHEKRQRPTASLPGEHDERPAQHQREQPGQQVSGSGRDGRNVSAQLQWDHRLYQ